MSIGRSAVGTRRRTFVKAGLAAGILQVASPFVFRARAADVVKIGLDNPLTGPLGGLGKTN